MSTLKQAVGVAQKIEDADSKADSLSAIVSALVYAEEFKQALEVARKIKYVRNRASAITGIAMTLATELIPENKKDNPDRRVGRRIKKAFTPKEKQLARQLVEAVQGN